MIIIGIIALLTGTIALLSKGRIFESAWGFALVGIPAIGAAVYLLIYIGFTYLFQALQKNSVNNGWKFYAGEAPERSRKFFAIPDRR